MDFGLDRGRIRSFTVALNSRADRLTVHFLHIGKTGGNAVREALAPAIADGAVTWHGHATNLADIPRGERVAFFVRDPVTRFISGFNSRLRKGQPRNLSEWSLDERTSFERYRTPNTLAEALASGEPATRDGAEQAMLSISHVSKRLTDFLTSKAYVEARRDDIAFVGAQETLAADFERLKRVLKLPQSISLPADAVVAHRTPEGFSRTLSPTGRAAIEAWYDRDIALHRWLMEANGFAVANAGALDPG